MGEREAQWVTVAVIVAGARSGSLAGRVAGFKPWFDASLYGPFADADDAARILTRENARTRERLVAGRVEESFVSLPRVRGLSHRVAAALTP